MVSVIARIPVKEDQVAACLAALEELTASVAREPGAVLYTVNRAAGEPHTLVVMERYRDQAALDAHSSAPHLQTFFSRLPDFLAGKPQVTVMEELLSI
ncbi:MAG TPA: putative quinol monooxygenase [Deferrisomatales bacterium]|nr:putative quinol monooxygenase [Deferrisomatales bacterium]